MGCQPNFLVQHFVRFGSLDAEIEPFLFRLKLDIWLYFDT